MRQINNNKGFTLIELLVVVAIIALLVSILLPSLNKARDAAKITVSQTNAKQWGTALYMYALDNNDRMPQEGNENKASKLDLAHPGEVKYHWLNVIPPQMGSLPYYKLQETGFVPMPGNGIESVYMSPMDRMAEGSYDGSHSDREVAPYASKSGPLYLNYVFNSKYNSADGEKDITVDGQSYKLKKMRKLSNIERTSSTVLIVERRTNNDDVRELPTVETVQSQDPDTIFDKSVRDKYADKHIARSTADWQRLSGRNNNQSLIIFSDGSARLVDYADTQKVNPDDSDDHNTDRMVWTPGEKAD